MDTKSLYDCANEAEIGFQHDDGYYDAIEPWTKLLLDTPEYLADVWIDFLAEEMKPDETPFLKLVDHLKRADVDFTAISKKGSHIPGNLDSTVIWGNSLNQNMTYVGMYITQALKAGAEKYVTKNAEQWWADCQGYAGDMEEGREDDRADHAYDAMVERKLDERA